MNLFMILMGYCRIGADAKNCTELLNLCMENAFPYTDFQCDEAGTVSFCCQRRVAKRIITLCRTRNVRVLDMGRGGLPHFLWRYRVRAGMMIGLLLGAALLWLSGQFVWDVRVDGNVSMSEEDVEDALRLCGFGVGSYIPDFRGEVIETRVMLESDRIAWISVYIDGTVARVQIRENEMPPPPESHKPANLIATCDGEIELLEIYRGDCVVKIGQTVSAGELLVSGVYDSQTVGYRYCRAAGKVLARVEEEFLIEIPMRETQKVYSEAIVSEMWLEFFDFSLKFFKNSRNQEGEYDIIYDNKNLEIFGVMNLPFGLRIQKRLPYRLETVSRTEEEALELAYEQLARELDGRAEEMEILQKRIVTELGEQSVVLRCKLVCIRDVAEQVEFEVSP